MSLETQIDSLIEAARKVIESDFSPSSLSKWRSEAFDCVTHLMGPDHTCTRYFEACVEEGKGGAGSRDALAMLAAELEADKTSRSPDGKREH